MQQAINVAKKLNRKVAFVGRSTEVKAQIAKDLGYLHYPENLVVPFKRARKVPKQKIMYIISGSYGQPGSALYRVANGEHDFLSMDKGDAVIFSSDPAPPGSKANVDRLVDRFIEIGVDVHYYEMQEDLHVSGHGCREDIKMLFALLKPKYFIPVGGTVRHMREYKNIAVGMGAAPDSTFELKPGGIVEFNNGKGNHAGKIDVKSILVDGLGVGDVGNVVLRDRKKLAKDGVAIVLLQLDRRGNKLITNPEVISRGFVFEKQEKGLLIESARLLVKELEKKQRLDRHVVRRITIDFLEKYFFRLTGRRPMILPVVVEA
jgi:ribonuclease J